jgi:hypothetical protein
MQALNVSYFIQATETERKMHARFQDLIFEKPSGQFLGLIVMSHWLGEVWIWIRDSSFCFSFIFLSFGESRLLVSWCAGSRSAWCAATRIMEGVGDLVQRIGDGRTGRVLDGRAIERLGCAVCGLHRARGDEERGFLGWASKPRLTVCQWLSFKTKVDAVVVLVRSSSACLCAHGEPLVRPCLAFF